MADKRGYGAIFSFADCESIASEYDGSTRSLDALVAKWGAIREG